MGAMQEHVEPDGHERPLFPVPCENPENVTGVSGCYESPINRSVRKLKIASMQRHSNSFQKWRRQMQKAWKWGSLARDQTLKPSFNPEILANQKRQWYRIHSHAMERRQHKAPTSLFEQFFIVGLHADTDLEAIEDAFARREVCKSDNAKLKHMDIKHSQQYRPSFPTLEPQILFQYPPRKRLSVRVSDIPSFCFPSGIKAHMVERTPSMSDLNELIYGQEHLNRDDASFIFSLKVANNATFYGVCLHVQEVVQRLPGFLGPVSPLSQAAEKGRRFSVSAPRCYCILTRLPFFELHYEMLNSIISQERLDRITEFVRDMTLIDHIPLVAKQPVSTKENSESLKRDGHSELMASAQLHSELKLTAASAGVVADTEVQFSHSPESASASEISDFSQARETDRDNTKGFFYIDGYASEGTSDSQSDSFERINGSYENGHTSPEIGSFYSPASRRLERIGSSESLLSCSVRSLGSEDDDMDEFSSKFPDEDIIEWAKEHNNGLLLIVCGYHAKPIPPYGADIIFQPLEHLHPVKYTRPGLAALGLSENLVDLGEDASPSHVPEVNERLAFVEEVLALSVWTIAALCRALSLESVLALVTGALLEKQIVVICPNLGILSAVVLSVIPIIHPFEWQSLLLPVLPQKMTDFLDAPVPFIVGIQHKPDDLKIRSTNVICINVFKDQVKMSSLPQLPRQKELVAELAPIHAKLSYESSVAKRQPVYKCSHAQAEAAGQFLDVMRSYLHSICSNLQTHTITSVQSNKERVSLLLKDSFIDSFPSRDRPFMKLHVETQLFSVLSDYWLSRFEHE